MREFKIKPSGFKVVRKRILLYMYMPMLIIIITVMLITSMTGNGIRGFIQPWLPVLLFGGFMAFTITRTLKRTRLMLDSYIFTITDNMIIREQVNTPTICIYLNNIKSIVKNKIGSFIIRAKQGNDMIVIPSQIENREELEKMLSDLQPISSKSDKTLLYSLLTLAGTISLGACLCISTDKWLIGASAILLAGFVVWAFIMGRKNKNIDYRAKRSLWIFLLVAFSILYFAAMKIFGDPMIIMQKK